MPCAADMLLAEFDRNAIIGSLRPDRARRSIWALQAKNVRPAHRAKLLGMGKAAQICLARPARAWVADIGEPLAAAGTAGSFLEPQCC